MTDLYFTIDSKSFLRRTDANPISNQTDDEYICHFSFEGEDWTNTEKFVSFTFKKQIHTILLGTELECSTPIPFDVLKNCLTTIKVFTEFTSTRNQISLVINQPKTSSDKQCPEQQNFRDAFAEAYSRINTKIDNVQIEGTDIVFYANNKEISRLILEQIGFKQSDWIETDESNISFIKNKPMIIDGFEYENKNLILSSNGSVQQELSMEHTHVTDDITDFDEEVDIDLSNLLINITENIRSL